MLKQHIIAVSAVLALMSCRPTGTGQAQETQEKGDSLVLLFTGDVLLDRGVRYQAERHGWGRTEEERLTPTLISRGDVTAALFCAVLFPLENWEANPDDAAPCQTNAFRLARAHTIGLYLLLEGDTP